MGRVRQVYADMDAAIVSNISLDGFAVPRVGDGSASVVFAGLARRTSPPWQYSSASLAVRDDAAARQFLESWYAERCGAEDQVALWDAAVAAFAVRGCVASTTDDIFSPPSGYTFPYEDLLESPRRKTAFGKWTVDETCVRNASAVSLMPPGRRGARFFDSRAACERVDCLFVRLDYSDERRIHRHRPASREWFQTMTHLLAAKNETTHLLKVYDAPPAPGPDAPTSPNEFNLSEKLRNWSPGDLDWRALHTTRHPRVGVPDFGVASLCDWIIFRENGTCGFRTYLVRRRRVPRTVWLGNRNFDGGDAIRVFADRVLPRLTRPVVLYSGSEDSTLPLQVDARFGPNDGASVLAVLNSPLVERWVVENLVTGGVDWPHPEKMVPLPVGFVLMTATQRARALELLGRAWTAPKDLRVACAARMRAGPQWEPRRRVGHLCAQNWSAFADAPPPEARTGDGAHAGALPSTLRRGRGARRLGRVARSARVRALRGGRRRRPGAQGVRSGRRRLGTGRETLGPRRRVPRARRRVRRRVGGADRDRARGLVGLAQTARGRNARARLLVAVLAARRGGGEGRPGPAPGGVRLRRRPVLRGPGVPARVRRREAVSSFRMERLSWPRSANDCGQSLVSKKKLAVACLEKKLGCSYGTRKRELVATH